jgi:hypothetical protein
VVIFPCPSGQAGFVSFLCMEGKEKNDHETRYQRFTTINLMAMEFKVSERFNKAFQKTISQWVNTSIFILF